MSGTIDEYIDRLSKIIQTNPRSGGPRHNGLVILQSKDFGQDDYARAARLLVGTRFGGKKAVASCFRAAGLVTTHFGWELTWRQDFSLGAYLIGCLNIAGYYTAYRDFDRGTRAEYWLEVEDKKILQFPEADPSFSFKPRLDWVSKRKNIGNPLVKPSHPQLKETVWNPYLISEHAAFKNVWHNPHAGRMPWMRSHMDQRQLEHKNKEWWKAVVRLSETAFQVNQEVLTVAKEIDQDSVRRLPEDIDNFSKRKEQIEERRLKQNIDELRKQEQDGLSSEEDKTLKQFRADFHGLMNQHRSTVSKREAFDRTIEKAIEIGDKVFYNQVFADYRGRIYFRDGGLSYQGADLQRAMVQFPNGKPIKESDWKYLWLQIANTSGKKGTWQDRVETAKSMQSDVLRYAKSPIETYDEWSKAPDKWQFLRTCFEIRDLLDNPKHPSKLIIEQDQSTSCFQHMGLLTDNIDMLKMVNIGPDYSDIYQIIGDSLELKTEVSQEHRRKIAKAALVPFGYGSGVETIADAYDELDLPYLVLLSPDERFGLAKEVVEKIEELLPAAKEFKETMRKKAKRLLNQGFNEFIWQSPSGFEIHHYKQLPVPENDTLRPTLYLGNGKAARLQAIEPSTVPDTERLARGLPPNFIHSIDAAVLHFVLADSDIPIAVVHDAYGSLVADASQVNKLFFDKLLYIYDQHHPSLYFNTAMYQEEPEPDGSLPPEITPIPWPFHNNIFQEAKALIKNSQHALT